MKFKIYSVIAFLLISFKLSAQSSHDSRFAIYQGGIYFVKNNDAEGSPFLYEDWKMGSVFLRDGTIFNNLQLKFDASIDKFLSNRNDTAYLLSDDISEVVIHNDLQHDDSTYDTFFTNNINTASKVKPGNFVEVLSKGKISIIKDYKKNIEGENTNNGFTKTIKQYTLHTYTWAIIDDKAIPVKYTSNFLEEITADKKEQIKEYLKAKKLNPKNEKDFILAIKFYNSLSK